MTQRDLTGKRVLVLGAETALGRALASAVVEAGADIAVVAASADPESAFAVQRLARRLSGGGRRVIAQAIDAGNEMALRVMVRQVAKELGGLEAIALVTEGEVRDLSALRLAVHFGGKELARTGGTFVGVGFEPWEQPAAEMRAGFTYVGFPVSGISPHQAVEWTLHAM